jgi:PAS domain S-box-containing protein
LLKIAGFSFYSMVIAFFELTLKNRTMNNQSTSMASPVITIPERRKINDNRENSEDARTEFISTAQLYDAVYENAFHPMYISALHGKIIKFNDKFSSLFGFLPGEIDQLNATDLFKTNDRSFMEFVQKRNENGIAKAEVRGIKKSGEIFPCRISSVFYQSEKGEKRFMNTLVNISDHISARWNIAG